MKLGRKVDLHKSSASKPAGVEFEEQGTQVGPAASVGCPCSLAQSSIRLEAMETAGRSQLQSDALARQNKTMEGILYALRHFLKCNLPSRGMRPSAITPIH